MLYRILLLISTTLVGVGCQNHNTRPFRPAKINHLVFFSLKSSVDRSELIADCDETLSTIDGVVSYWCGEHGDFGRTAVDEHYDVGFYVGFDSAEAYDQYVQNPAHLSLVEKWKPRWNWIRIHDVVDTSP